MAESESRKLQRETLEQLKQRRDILNSAIVNLEDELSKPEWHMSDEDWKKAWEWAESEARKFNELSNKWEIERYGRLLTHAERQGWVTPPKQLKEQNAQVKNNKQ